MYSNICRYIVQNKFEILSNRFRFEPDSNINSPIEIHLQKSIKHGFKSMYNQILKHNKNLHTNSAKNIFLIDYFLEADFNLIIWSKLDQKKIKNIRSK